MKFPVKAFLIKSLKISSLLTGILCSLLFLLPYLFPQTVNTKIKDWANSRINGKLAFSEVGLSFFKHFPSLTFTLYDVTLNGSQPFEKDTLLSAKELGLGIDLSSLFKSTVNINKIFLENGYINIQVDKDGKANYNVYRAEPTQNTAPKDSSKAALKLENIQLENCHLIYNDRSLPMMVNAKGFHYSGKGDLSESVFDLHTHTEINSVDLYYGGQPYILSKKVNADLITRVNTNTLAFIFEKNDLKINKLPVDFKGRFEFLKNGYSMNFNFRSAETDLHNIITALPPEYLKWLEKTEVKGHGDLALVLAGKYIASTHISPDLSFKMKIRNGYIANENAPFPIENLFLDFETQLPGLNPDSLGVNIDSVYFKVDKGFFNSVVRVKGIKAPKVYAKINTQLDLAKWHRAFGLKPFEVKGQFDLSLLAEGQYKTGIVRSGVRKVDTVITSIPKFDLKSHFRNGYFKYASLPQAMEKINFNILANCTDNDYKHSTLAVSDLNFTVLDNFVKGHFNLINAKDFPVDARIQTNFNLGDIRKFYPLEGMEILGKLNVDIQSKGKYSPAKKLFPVTKANFTLQDGTLKTKYSPLPIERIQVSAEVVNKSASTKDLKVNIRPISFQFANQPFTLKAQLQNLDDLRYNVSSNGSIDIGKLYKVFAVDGYGVNGLIKTNFSLKGRQSDAASGNYNKLSNSGSMRVRNLQLTSDLFPKPFMINSGLFSFYQDKVKFETFKAVYGKSDFELNGEISNIINYATKPNASLKGNFDLKSKLIAADEFMAYADAPKTQNSTSAATGVVIVPANLDIQFKGEAQKVNYNGLNLKDFKGQIAIKDGNIALNETGFSLIDAPVTMNGNYKSISPKKAQFDYQIKADEFDIKKAYKEIKLFRDMASSASSAEGIVSLDYKLSGKLNQNMQPVYPSLKGGGVLSVKKIKMKGFKLLNAIGKKTDHNGITDPDLSKVNIKSSISNNIISIERTKVKMAGFRLRFEGKVDFNNKMNMSFRLGLPPFGIFGIPMTITGTSEKPKIKLGKSNKTDDPEEEKDTEN